MSRSRTSSHRTATLEGLSLQGMVLGVAVMLQPWWAGGMRAGFFLAGVSTIAQIVLGHLRRRAPSETGP